MIRGATLGVLVFAACVASAADPYASSYRPPPHTDVLIRGATLLDGAGGRIDDADVLIREGRVSAIGRGLDAKGARVIDARDRWVTPGIIDVHSHNGTYSMPQTSLDAEASDVSELRDPNAADTWVEHAVNPADPAFAAALRAGVTTLQIMPGSVPVFGGRTVVVKPLPALDVRAIKFPGAPQGLKMSCGENTKSYYAEKDRGPTSRQGAVAIARAAFTQAQEYRAAWRAHERRASRPPPARDLKLETLVGVLEGEIPVHMHCYRASDMTTMLAVAEEFGFQIRAFHHATEGYKVVDALKRAGTCVAVWSDWWGFKVELLDAIRENAAMVDAGGGCVMMHSDSPILGQRLTIEAAKAAAAGRGAGIDLPPEHLIEWVTSRPARALGLGERIGKVAPGFNADLVVWSGNPFSIYSHADQVFIDGALAWDRTAATAAPRSDFELGRPETEPAG